MSFPPQRSDQQKRMRRFVVRNSFGTAVDLEKQFLPSFNLGETQSFSANPGRLNLAQDLLRELRNLSDLLWTLKTKFQKIVLLFLVIPFFTYK